MLNKDYAYVKFDTVVPDEEETYTIRVTGPVSRARSSADIPVLQQWNWDIYPEGKMTGLNSGEDLT